MWTPPAITTYRIINRGIGHQTTAQLLLRLDADLIQLRPNVVVIEAGVNDLKSIADFPDRRVEIVADCERNLATVVDRCRRAGATVVLVTVFEIGDVAFWRRPFWSPEVEPAVRAVNEFLRTLAGDNVVIFDANSLLADGGGRMRRGYQVDYLHVSSSGYAALNERLTPLVSSLPSRNDR
jgi:lysophospholipase L1-like esterase